ncbi:MAG: hypothetical protein PWQ12_676 [Clostridiales bacterium]|jgi:hypothetical protein|nr:hypothetical protein [Clostridiales bacterium]
MIKKILTGILFIGLFVLFSVGNYMGDSGFLVKGIGYINAAVLSGILILAVTGLRTKNQSQVNLLGWFSILWSVLYVLSTSIEAGTLLVRDNLIGVIIVALVGIEKFLRSKQKKVLESIEKKHSGTDKQ